MHTVQMENIQEEFERVIATIDFDAVRVQQDGRDVAIILSPQLYDMLLAEPPAGVSPRVAALFKQSVVERGQVYRALARYEAQHPDLDDNHNS